MLPQTYIDATDLNLWANRNDASLLLPKLLRRLVLTTIRDINFIGFRAGDGVFIGGWDGRLNVGSGNAFVPEGKSVWEIGTNKGIRAKANEDYEKRKVDPLGYSPAETTYIFVTPRRWRDKDEWIIERQSEGVWKDVRAYDADDIEAWLEIAPNIHIWLSILLGKHPESVVDSSNYWSEWTGVTNPPLSAELVISGRSASTDELYSWLGGAPSVCALQSESKQEAIAFLAASLELLPEEQREHYVYRCVVVESIAAWRRLVTAENGLILLPNFNDREGVSNATRAGHHVLIPLGRADAPAQQTLIIPRVHRDSAKQALVNMGLPQDKADALATLARRSLLALRRRLAMSPEVQQPTWATPTEARSLLPVVLAGQWVDSNVSDREVLARLARAEYEIIDQILSRWANEPDPPVRRIGNTWLVVSKEDAWSLIARFLTREDLDNFEQVVLDVLEVLDPGLELSRIERWRAAILDKKPSHSHYLREGLVETLTVMAARSDGTTWLDAVTGKDRVDRIVWKLLERANHDWRLWASIADLLPLLAEAAPTIFLEAVDKGLSGDDRLLLNLFSEDEDSLFGGGSHHTHLLWALELLAWHSDYLSHSALLLARLARLDPGGKLLNRPIRSLREIFLGWHPQTTANLDRRLQVIDLLRHREPDVAWKLMVALLPEAHSNAHPTSQPRWREWVPDPLSPVTYAELWRFVEEVVRRLLEDVATSGRWSDLLSSVPELPKEQQDDILTELSNSDINLFTSNSRMSIWETLRRIISRHREFPDADWAMPSALVDRMASVYEKFTPEDLIDRYSWLFLQRVELPDPPPRDSGKKWELRAAALDKARSSALQVLCSQGGLALINQTIEKIDDPHLVGFVLGKNEEIEIDDDVLLNEYLASQEQPRTFLALGFVSGRFHSKGWDWAEAIFKTKTSTWSPEQKANFLSCLPFMSQTWDMLESLSDAEAEHSYWSRIRPGYIKDTDFERATKKLLQYKRPHFAIDFLALFSHGEEAKVQPILALEVLEQLIAVTREQQIQWGDIGYDISRLMEIVRESPDIDQLRVAKLEWYFMPLLENYGGGPTLLHQELSRDPNFFVELIQLIFRSDRQEPDEQLDDNAARAESAFRIINSWHICPGESQGSVDRELLQDWVSQARAKLHDSGRGTIGDQQIGQALAESPPGTDGVYPHEHVREIIEQLSNQEIERGFEVRLFNNRGVTTRGLTDGGGQERALADKYRGYADQINDKYPRTAAMLRRIAESYQKEARREDISAELTEDFWR
jgi:hypothetical protein